MSQYGSEGKRSPRDVVRVYMQERIFKIKEYFMQDCMMHSENTEFSRATARNREVKGSEGQSFDTF